MSSQPTNAHDESAVSVLYHALIAAWNNRSAHDYATLFLDDATVIGFDGSSMNGRAEIESTLSTIFADHPTAAYVSKIREVRFLALDAVVLRAIVGMIPPGKTALNPERNALQTLIANRHDGQWRIVLFQNTPARFDGRPDLSEALTQELSQLL